MMATRDIEELEQELLRSARLLDVPSDQGRRAARALSALVAASAAAVSTGGLGANGAARMGAARTAQRLATAGRAWVGWGIGIATIAGGLLAVMLRIGVPRATTQPAAEAPLVNTAPAPSAVPSQVEPLSPPGPDLLAAPKARGPAKRPAASVAIARPVTSAVPVVHGTSFADQIAALDAVRASLAAGRAGDALRMLDDFDRRFPEGALSQESTVTRVEALLSAGRPAEARAEAERFLASHPSSTHAAHVRELLESPSTGTPR